MRVLKILGVLTVVLLVATAGTMAQQARDQIQKVKMPPREGLYSRSSLIPPNVVIVPLPTPSEPAMATAPAPMPTTKSGPVFDMAPPEVGAGGALMTPRGSAMSSPKVRADREIRRLVRKLG